MFRNALFFICLIFLMMSSCKKEKAFERYIPKRVDVSWMSSLLKQFPEKDVKFSDISMPGSHDAGVYMLRKCSFGANACNTQTQHLNMGKQLEAGYRIFDVRPMLMGGEYYAHHTTECGGLGCQGDYIRNMFQFTNDFLEKHTEIVLLSFGHFCSMSPDDPDFLKIIDDILGDKVYKETKRIDYLYDWSLRDVLGENPQKGKVILLFDNSGIANSDENRRKGYFSSRIMSTVGGWSNKNVYRLLKEDQLLKYNNYQPKSPDLFQFSWQMTQETAQAIACAVGDQSGSILSMSKESNPDFALVIDSMVQSGAIHSGKYPHVFWLDYGDEWMIDIAKAISEISIMK